MDSSGHAQGSSHEAMVVPTAVVERDNLGLDVYAWREAVPHKGVCGRIQSFRSERTNLVMEKNNGLIVKAHDVGTTRTLVLAVADGDKCCGLAFFQRDSEPHLA